MEMIRQRKGIIIPIVFGIIFSLIYTMLPLKSFLGLIGASFFAIMCIKDIRIGVMLSILVMPFLPDLLILLLMIFMLGILIFNLLVKDQYSISPKIADIPVLIFAVVITIATVTSIDRSGSFRDLAIHLSSLGFVAVIVLSIKSRKNLNILLTFFVLAQTLVALYGISQYFTGVELDPAWVDEANNPEIFTRIFSVFGNPNILAEYLILGIPVSMSLFFTSKKLLKKLLFLGTTLILLLTLVLTLSRGSWLGFAFGVAVFVLLINKKLLLLSIPIGIIGVFVLPDSIIHRISSIGNLADSSNAYRIVIWAMTLKIIRENWLVGLGFGYAPFKQVFESNIRTMPIFHAHNTYLEITAELGIVGILLFVALLFVMYKYSILNLIKSNNKFIKYTTAAILASISGLLVQGLVEHVLYLTRIIATFWILIGVLLVLMRLEKGNRNLVEK